MMRVLLPLLLALSVAGVAAAQTVPAAKAGAAAPPAPAAPPASAATPASPYSATVPVAGTSDAQRNTAISAALGQVLQQVSPGFTATPAVLAQASGYVRDFHYRRALSGNGLELQVDFDPGAIGRLVATGTAGAAPGGNAAAAGGVATAATVGAAPAVQGGSGNLWVDGIGNGHAFTSLLSMLRGDAQLQDVMPVVATGDGVMLHLAFDQPLATILAGLTAPGGHLTPDAQPHPGADAALRWNP